MPRSNRQSLGDSLALLSGFACALLTMLLLASSQEAEAQGTGCPPNCADGPRQLCCTVTDGPVVSYYYYL